MFRESHLPFISLLPNIVTLIGMTIGLTSIRYSMDAKWEYAVALIVISAFIDGFDGRLARALNASSKFGAELDSLSDFANFGVAPAILLYSWSLHSIPFKGVGWAVAALVIICCAFRLARFNSNESSGERGFFQGVSAPCGGGLLLVPIMLSFDDIAITMDVTVVAGYAVLIALLMASNIPTISIKRLQIPRILLFPILIAITAFFVLLVIRPWVFLPLLGLIYILSIPVTILLHHKRTLANE
jgi:CDP-diacylglycerol---serine O-phosphatidyltransferase